MGAPHEHDPSDELLQRALLEPEASAAVALRVEGLSLSRALTVVFHGRRDLGTIQTYVAHGPRGAGDAIGASEMLRVPCDLDLADAGSREEAEQLYAEQARALRDAIQAADTVLAVWRDALVALADAPVGVDRSIELHLDLPAHRLMPVALVDPEHHLTIAPVCSARTLAAGLPPMGIAIAQQDVAHVYAPARRPRALPRRLRRARGGARPAHGRAPGQAGGQRPPLPRDQRARGLRPDGLTAGAHARETSLAARGSAPRCVAAGSSSRWAWSSSWRSPSSSPASSRPRTPSAPRSSRCSRTRRAATSPGSPRASTAATRRCADGLQSTVARAKRPGDVKILRLDSAGSFTLGERTGRSRVAWAADVAAGGVAVVQCVTVRREWGLLAGASVTLLRLSAPLPPEKGC